MQTTQNYQRSSSCSKVELERNPQVDLFADNVHPNIYDFSPERRMSFQLGISSFESASSSSILERSTSRPSSMNFCDLELEEIRDAYDNHLKDLEEGLEKEDKIPSLMQISLEPAENKEEQSSKPKAKDSRLSVIFLDQGFFTVYKRLFILYLAFNIVTLVLAATRHFSYAKRKATLFSIGNIFTLILCHNEAFLRIGFYVSMKLFGSRWVPLPVKTAVTSLLQSLGGIHSGCGVSSIVWLIYSLVITLRNRESTSKEIITVASAILSLLSLSSLAAFPLVRHLHHNVFERTHRLAGWVC